MITIPKELQNQIDKVHIKLCSAIKNKKYGFISKIKHFISARNEICTLLVRFAQKPKSKRQVHAILQGSSSVLIFYDIAETEEQKEYIKELLEHEIIHWIDPKQYDTAFDQVKKYQRKDLNYYCNPLEFTAYSYCIIKSIIRSIKKNRIDKKFFEEFLKSDTIEFFRDKSNRDKFDSTSLYRSYSLACFCWAECDCDKEFKKYLEKLCL